MTSMYITAAAGMTIPTKNTDTITKNVPAVTSTPTGTTSTIMRNVPVDTSIPMRNTNTVKRTAAIPAASPWTPVPVRLQKA